MKYENTLKYRSAWMGIAMLWVVVYHSFYIFPINFFKNIGYGGVDICLFASGLGCYYSLCSNDDIAGFVKKRFLRIFPTYWCFLPFWFLYAFNAFDMDLSSVLGNILGIQNFTSKGLAFNWYISAILLFYILAPYFKKLADRFDGFKQILIVILMFAISVPFWSSNTLIITVSRLPVFYIGMLFAKSSKKSKKLSAYKIVVYLLVSIAGFILLWMSFEHFSDYRWTHALYWYPFILITPGLCVCVSVVMNLLDKSKVTSIIPKIFSFIGKYSFEIYLTHILIFDSVGYMVNSGTLPNEKTTYILALVSVPFACAILFLITKGVTKLSSTIFLKKK
ncbi:MAG: acyltransferase [Eubacteriales bacterium]|nr:acyltransferase [Eubacteriales bacterium]